LQQEPSAADITKALELAGIRINASHDEFMKYFAKDPNDAVREAVRQIRDYDPLPRYEVRKKLIVLRGRLWDTLDAINKLERRSEWRARPELKAELDRAAAEIKEPAVKGSGGRRLGAARIRVAAVHAFNLLDDWGAVPTLTRKGSYLKLTKRLYWIATGKHHDPGPACKAVADELEWRGRAGRSERIRHQQEARKEHQKWLARERVTTRRRSDQSRASRIWQVT
jgi:hypothetical protein